GLAAGCFVRSNLVTDVVQHISEVQRVERPEAEVDAEFQPRLSGRRVDAVILLEEEDPKTVKTRVLHTQTVLGLVHAEPAGTARSRREEHVIVDNLLL